MDITDEINKTANNEIKTKEKDTKHNQDTKNIPINVYESFQIDKIHTTEFRTNALNFLLKIHPYLVEVKYIFFSEKSDFKALVLDQIVTNEEGLKRNMTTIEIF